MMMKPVLSSRWRARLLAIACGLGAVPAVPAQPLPFAGEWLRDAPPGAPASYPGLNIQDGSIAWSSPGKSMPACVQQFALKQEKPGTVYADGRGTRFVAGAKGSLPTYLLHLSGSTCSGVEDEVRISFPMVYDKDHIEFIEYANGRPISARRFHRKK
jgi:hypothetical protein